MMDEPTYAPVIEDFEKNIRPLLYLFPASLKYHQNWKGGLARHTSLVARFADRLFNFLPATIDEYNTQTTRNPPEELRIDFTSDEIFVAALFHDVGKIFDYIQLPDGRFEYRKNNENVFEPKIPQSVWDDAMHGHMYLSRPEHEILSCNVAKSVFERNNVPWSTNIENAILCHSGGWSKTGIKPLQIAMMLHCADILGSQFGSKL